MVELSRDEFIVTEDDCNVVICLTKNMDTAETLTIDVFLTEIPFGATGIAKHPLNIKLCLYFEHAVCILVLNQCQYCL